MFLSFNYDYPIYSIPFFSLQLCLYPDLSRALQFRDTTPLLVSYYVNVRKYAFYMDLSRVIDMHASDCRLTASGRLNVLCDSNIASGSSVGFPAMVLAFL